MSYMNLPSVDAVLNSKPCQTLLSTYGRRIATEAIRATLDDARATIRSGKPAPAIVDIIRGTAERLDRWFTPTLIPVINATGVIIHTNLGRAPLSEDAQRAVQGAASGYSTLEFNLSRGKRGKREVHAEELLVRLTGAEAAFVVNNNAAAVLLTLTALARRKEVIIARSQLIEIGGGFRIPAVMKQSGARLVEVGTTNRTHLDDVRNALTDRTALILQVHHSNFKLIGFTTEPALADVVALAQEQQIPVLSDLGSGTLLDTAAFGLGHEPTIQETLAAGADVVCFSGDKLLGGPQAGILVGRKDLIARMRKHPLARAVRPDKLCLAALSATLLHYLREEALEAVPVWQMIAASAEELRSRAKVWAQKLDAETRAGQSTVGGGSLPEETLPTTLLAFSPRHPNAFTRKLRHAEIPIIARIEQGQVLIDPRTVLPHQEQALLDTLHNLQQA